MVTEEESQGQATKENKKEQEQEDATIEAIDAILTIPNVISFLRLCLVPVFLVFLLRGHDFIATLLFGIAAVTDFLDGMIARRTNRVSKVGQVLDPAVDRILMIAGVVGAFLVGRLPLWTIILIFLRDFCMLAGGIFLISRYHIRIAVVYPGKVSTALLFIGFVGLLLNWPLIGGLGICDFPWLPGFNMNMVSWGIWLVYAGMLLAIGVTVYYAIVAWGKLKVARAQREEQPEEEQA